MILEPRKSAEEIDRRLSALNDPELTDLLKSLRGGLFGEEPQTDAVIDDDPDSYTSPSAPYWKRRIAFIALAGLFGLSAGYASISTLSHSAARGKPPAAAPIPVPKKHAREQRSAPIVHRKAAVSSVSAAVTPAASVTVPNEALIRQMRAELVHERALAAQAQAKSAHAQRQAKLAAQEQAMAREWAHAEAIAQARAEAQAQATARAQAEDAQMREREQDQALQNASDPNIKPGDAPPADNGRVSTYPTGGAPVWVPGPVDTNCTPHRGSLFTSVLSHVRVGGTNVGALVELVGH